MKLTWLSLRQSMSCTARRDLPLKSINPRQPASPNRPLLLFGVLLAGLAVGVGTAFGLTQLKSTFSTAGALERALDLPVLGTISESLSERNKALRAKRMKLFYAASGSLGGLFVLLLGIEFLQRGMVA